MPIWKISENGPEKVQETTLRDEELLEENLEDWIFQDPIILGEPLLVIGRQVMIPDIRDRLDILALDPQGNAVVIELKRGQLKDPVDMQALRYASYISKWSFEDFENQAKANLGGIGDPEFNFNEIYEQFCMDAGVEEVPDINSDQRVIIVGSEVRDKLGSVALWLLDHNIDIKVIEMEVFREEGRIFLQPRVIVPLEVSRFKDVGRGPKSDASRPWISDGQTWHLEKRCSIKTKGMLLELNDFIRDNFDVDGPRWNQKGYVAYRMGNYNWLVIVTSANMLRLQFNVKAGRFDAETLATRLGVQSFDRDDSMAEKLGLPSSVIVLNRGENSDRVNLRVKEDFNLESDEFLEFLKEAYEAFPK